MTTGGAAEMDGAGVTDAALDRPGLGIHKVHAAADGPRVTTSARRTRLLTIASRYPSDVQPTRGLVVEERVRALVGSGRIIASVVSPVPWFPLRSGPFGRWSGYARMPVRERRFGIVVDHPSYLVLPALIGFHAATAMFRVLLALLQQRRQRGADFDVIEANALYPDGVAAIRLAQALGKRCILSVRGSDAGLRLPNAAPSAAIARALASASAVIASSGAVRDRLTAMGANPAITHVVHAGVDTGRFRMLGHNTVKRKLRLDGNIWLAVGPLERHRNFDSILSALAAVPDATLLVLGDGADEARLRKFADTRGVASRIHFMGATQHNELPRYYNAADALFDASGGSDVPNSALEALACGTPVVAAPGAGVRDAFTTAAAGVIASSGDGRGLAAAWSQLAANPPQRNDTRAFAETLGWDKSTAPLSAIYADAMVQGRRSTGAMRGA